MDTDTNEGDGNMDDKEQEALVERIYNLENGFAFMNYDLSLTSGVVLSCNDVHDIQ